MKRVFYPYNLWEEVDFGMYTAVLGSAKRDRLVKKALSLLSNPTMLEHYMRKSLTVFPKSTERNLTTQGMNKQAWLGQAACCLFGNVPSDITKEAWGMLTLKQKDAANDAADRVYEDWRATYA